LLQSGWGELKGDLYRWIILFVFFFGFFQMEKDGALWYTMRKKEKPFSQKLFLHFFPKEAQEKRREVCP
jgi:hypothetical protein